MSERPTMSSVSLMLSSFSMALEMPAQPAYFTQSPMLLNVPSQENLPQINLTATVNEVTVTEVLPRRWNLFSVQILFTTLLSMRSQVKFPLYHIKDENVL